MSDTRVFDVKTTTTTELVDITRLVRDEIRASGVESGIACVFCPHTTAALTIQEGTNPNVKHDLDRHLAFLVPKDGDYAHHERNIDAHIKSSVIGVSLSLIVSRGKPELGQWQSLFFCEFDGPRRRRVMVRVVPG